MATMAAAVRVSTLSFRAATHLKVESSIPLVTDVTEGKLYRGVILSYISQIQAMD
jgi:hypothetical protein